MVMMNKKILIVISFFGLILGCTTPGISNNTSYGNTEKSIDELLSLVAKYEDNADANKLKGIIDKDVGIIRKKTKGKKDPKDIINIFFSEKGLGYTFREYKKIKIKNELDLNYMYKRQIERSEISLSKTICERKGNCFELSLMLSIYLSKLDIKNGIIYSKNHSFVRYFYDGKWYNCETTELENEKNYSLEYYMNRHLGYDLSNNKKDFEENGRLWNTLSTIK